MSFGTISSSSSEVMHLYSRKLLLLDTQVIVASSPISEPYGNKPSKGFDGNAVMVLSVLVCALLLSLGLNSIIKCLRWCVRLLCGPRAAAPDSAISLTSTGITKKAQKAYLTMAYLAGPHVDTECVICLTAFATNEIVLILPKCHHGFHAECIGKWLRSHSSCPTCRHSLIEASDKIIKVSEVAPPETLLLQPLSPEEAIIVIIAPLEPEGVILNYRGITSLLPVPLDDSTCLIAITEATAASSSQSTKLV